MKLNDLSKVMGDLDSIRLDSCGLSVYILQRGSCLACAERGPGLSEVFPFFSGIPTSEQERHRHLLTLHYCELGFR